MNERDLFSTLSRLEHRAQRQYITQYLIVFMTQDQPALILGYRNHIRVMMRQISPDLDFSQVVLLTDPHYYDAAQYYFDSQYSQKQFLGLSSKEFLKSMPDKIDVSIHVDFCH